jgi:hypothetical protein
MWKICIALLWGLMCLGNLCSAPAIAETVGDCVALEFVTAGCPQCQKMDQSVSRAIDQGWVVRRIDIQADPYAAHRWRIHSTPTTLLIRGGREVDRILGPVPFGELVQRMMSASSPSKANPALDREVVETNAILAPAAPVGSQGPASQNAVPEMFPMLPVPKSLASRQVPRDAMAIAEQATVRIRVDEPEHQAVGTGTIIDCVNGEALVVTCGHLFRDLGPRARITVELFQNGQPETFGAQVIDFEAAERDIGLLAFRPGRAVVTSPLLPRSKRLQENETVFSIGCDHGRDPSRRDSRITKLNRYLGAPNVEVAGMPVQGRSGGGLFNDSGELIGVCYAADQELNEGLYCAPELIYEQIEKLGLHRLYDRAKETAPATLATSSPSQAITIIVHGADGEERKLHIQDPSPTLLQALASEGYVLAR